MGDATSVSSLPARLQLPGSTLDRWGWGILSILGPFWGIVERRPRVITYNMSRKRPSCREPLYWVSGLRLRQHCGPFLVSVIDGSVSVQSAHKGLGALTLHRSLVRSKPRTSGVSRLNLLVNNAGVMYDGWSRENWERHWSTNVAGQVGG